MSERELRDEEIIHIPVPKRFLPLVYRALAEAMAETTTTDGRANAESPTNAEPPERTQTGRRNLIDLITTVARELGADRRPVSLRTLYDAYMRAFPYADKGTTRGSFDATVNFHCINMRSRFPDPREPHRTASWLSRPVFKRIARAQYMLLTAEEIARFHRYVERDDPLVYEGEYDVDDLTESKEIHINGVWQPFWKKMPFGTIPSI